MRSRDSVLHIVCPPPPNCLRPSLIYVFIILSSGAENCPHLVPVCDTVHVFTTSIILMHTERHLMAFPKLAKVIDAIDVFFHLHISPLAALTISEMLFTPCFPLQG